MAPPPEAALIQAPPGDRVRFARSRPLIPIGVGVCAAFGPPRAWLRLSALAGAYVLATLAVIRLAGALDRPRLDALLTNVVNAAMVVAGLVLIGELRGPLVGLVVPCVLSATLLGGPRMGAGTALAALACYALALGLTAGGVIPGYPLVLSGEWPVLAAGVFAAFSFAGAVLRSDMLGGRAENALDAMPDGGKLDLEALRVERPRLVEFRLSDTGPGIPPGLHGEVFEPFFSTKSRGTGLGLSIARGIVLGHQARLSLDKVPHGGARVSLQIPSAPASAPA